MRTSACVLLFALFTTVPMFADSPAISDSSSTSVPVMEEPSEAALVESSKDKELEALYADLMEKFMAHLKKTPQSPQSRKAPDGLYEEATQCYMAASSLWDLCLITSSGNFPACNEWLLGALIVCDALAAAE